MSGLIKCCTCKKEKPETDYTPSQFIPRKGLPLGRRRCQQCTSGIDRRYRLKNLEKRRAYDRARNKTEARRERDRIRGRTEKRLAQNRERARIRYATDPVYRKKVNLKKRAYARASRAINPEKYRARYRAHYAADPEKHRERNRVYRAAKGEKIREYSRAYRQRPEIRARDQAMRIKKRLENLDVMRAKGRAEYHKHADRTCLKRRVRFDSDPEYREKIRHQARTRRIIKHKELNAYARAYYAANPEKVRSYQRKYHTKNPHIKEKHKEQRQIAADVLRSFGLRMPRGGDRTVIRAINEILKPIGIQI